MCRFQGSRILISLLLASAGSVATAAEGAPGDLLSLPPSGERRFEVTGRVWPGPADPPHICLWMNDALAAVSITIDDNTAPDHAWWLQQSERYGFRATWFVITALVNDQRPGYHGSWDDFRRLHRAGHDIQSHTVTHVSPGRGFDPDDPARDLGFEYAASREIIERQIPGQRALTLAFPGGAYQREHTDPLLAARHYIAARGTVGQINPADRVDYRQTCSIGNGLHIDDSRYERSRLIHLIDPARAYRAFQYRGWYVTHFHRVAEADKPRLCKAFAFLQQHRAEIWTGLFREVAQYGQERDTAEIEVTRRDARQVGFILSDGMPDDCYDFPLTVKVRIPEGWRRLAAFQDDRAVPVSEIASGGSRYALVHATPDRGEVVLRSAAGDPAPRPADDP